MPDLINYCSTLTNYIDRTCMNEIIHIYFKQHMMTSFNINEMRSTKTNYETS